MSKAYIVKHSLGICDDYSTVGVIFDEAKRDKYIEDHNKPRKLAEEKHEKCKRCRKCDDYDTPQDNVFLYKEDCIEAKIGTDRHGMYCGNDKSNYYEALDSTNEYFYEETELLE